MATQILALFRVKMYIHPSKKRLPLNELGKLVFNFAADGAGIGLCDGDKLLIVSRINTGDNELFGVFLGFLGRFGNHISCTMFECVSCDVSEGEFVKRLN